MHATRVSYTHSPWLPAGVDDASSVSSSVLAGGAAGDVVGSAALKMQTMMALMALLQGKKTAVVVQVGMVYLLPVMPA